jgi:hypothetical protein
MEKLLRAALWNRSCDNGSASLGGQSCPMPSGPELVNYPG